MQNSIGNIIGDMEVFDTELCHVPLIDKHVN